MSQTSILLKPINDLLGNTFIVPAYQRGYRWTDTQVLELLEDVQTFLENEDRNRDSFYCLQPIVVKEAGTKDEWEVVDGQQRLTTLFLILQFFNERLVENRRRKLYSLKYETRPNSSEFLINPSPEMSSDEVDPNLWTDFGLE